MKYILSIVFLLVFTFCAYGQARCNYTFSASSVSLPASGERQIITVTTDDARCTYEFRTEGTTSWVHGSAPQIGGFQFSDAIYISADPNQGNLRQGYLTVSVKNYVTDITSSVYRAFTVNQAAADCRYSLSAYSANFSATASNGTFDMHALSFCTWTITPQVDWITINLNQNANGNGTVGYLVASNNGAARTGTINAQGQIFTVNQASGLTACTYSFNPQLIPASGGAIDYGIVKNDPGCNIVVRGGSSNPAWVHDYTADANPGPARDGFVYFVVGSVPGAAPSLTNGSPQVLINQASGCSYSLATSSANVANNASSGTFDLHSVSGCTWQTSVSADWITVNLNAAGQGSATIGYVVAANTGAARTGTITAGGQTFTVTQAAGKSRKRILP